MFLAGSSLLNASEGCLMASTALFALVLSLLKNPFCITYASTKLWRSALARCRGDIAFHKRPENSKIKNSKNFKNVLILKTFFIEVGIKCKITRKGVSWLQSIRSRENEASLNG